MGMLNVSLDLKHDVNLFGFLFGKMKILQCPLKSRVSLLLQRKDENALKGLWYKRTTHGQKKTKKRKD